MSEMFVSTAAKFYKVSKTTITKWVNDGLLKMKLDDRGRVLIMIDEHNKPQEHSQPIKQNNVQRQPANGLKSQKVITPDRQAVLDLLNLQDIMLTLKSTLKETAWFVKHTVPSIGNTNPWTEELAPLADYEWLFNNLARCCALIQEQLDMLRLDPSSLQFINMTLTDFKKSYEWFYPPIPDGDPRKWATDGVPWSDSKPAKIQESINLCRQVMASMVNLPKQPVRQNQNLNRQVFSQPVEEFAEETLDE